MSSKASEPTIVQWSLVVDIYSTGFNVGKWELVSWSLTSLFSTKMGHLLFSVDDYYFHLSFSFVNENTTVCPAGRQSVRQIGVTAERTLS